MPIQHHVRHQLAVLAQYHVRTNGAIRRRCVQTRNNDAVSATMAGWMNHRGCDGCSRRDSGLLIRSVRRLAVSSLISLAPAARHDLATSRSPRTPAYPSTVAHCPASSPRGAPPVHHRHLDPQLVAGHHRPAKLSVLNAGEHHQLVIAVTGTRSAAARRPPAQSLRRSTPRA